MHWSDPDLQGFLDGELSEAEAHAVATHLAACRECAEGLRRLEGEHLAARELLSQLDHPAPVLAPERLMLNSARRSDARRMLLAAGMAALVLGGVAVAAVPDSPLHRYVSRLLSGGGAKEVQQPSEPRKAEQQPPVQSTERRPSGIAFVPGDELVITFKEPQAQGRIRVELHEDPMVRIHAVDGMVSYALAEATASIDNRGSTASYDLSIPRGLREARIRVAKHTVFVKEGPRIIVPTAPDEDETYVISLNQP